MEAYRLKRNKFRPKVREKYEILGFISSGTYGKVYKVKRRKGNIDEELAIKQFKPEHEGTKQLATGISQSACREIAICREFKHTHLVDLLEVMLEDNLMHMVMSYAEYDLLTILQFYNQARKPIPELLIKSLLYHLLEGVDFLHANNVLHRDLKPANLLIDADGVLKVGDLGLARLYHKNFQSFYSSDKIVVTVWYRSPELILGSRHYTEAIDVWAIGCIFGEMLSLRPMFKGEEVKVEPKKQIPFQKSQMVKICEILGSPTVGQWPDLEYMPEYPNLKRLRTFPVNFRTWFQNSGQKSDTCFSLLAKMLEFDPKKRITTGEALQHPYFKEDPVPVLRPLSALCLSYPKRPLSKEEKL